jgi:dihydroxyacetone kinase-like protein
MRTSADGAAAVQILERAAAVMAENKTVLIELDSVIGDGDLGITMEKGFAAAAQSAREQSGADPGTIFMKAGMAIAKTAPSTMGTLMASGLMRGGKTVAGKAELSAADMREFLSAFLQGVTERGKAKPGDKTILDILGPAVKAMESYAGDDVTGIWKEAERGAAAGVEAAKSLESQHGKAAVFREKTRGLEDPGGRAVYLLIKSFAEVLGV